MQEQQKHFLFLVNPASSKTDLETFTQCLKETQAKNNFEYTVEIVTKFDNKAYKKLGKKIQTGPYTHLVGVGGDGTIRMTLSIAAEFKKEMPVGIVPTGTGNLLAKILELPEELQEALDVVTTAPNEPFSITQVNNKYYCALVTGIGADAEVMAETTTGLKKLFGPIAYIISGIKAALTKNKALYWITIDGKKIFKRADGVLLLQRNAYSRAFTGTAPEEQHSENLLDVCILNAPNKLSILQTLQNLFKADYASDPNIEHHTGVNVKVKTWPKEKVQVDGDIIKVGSTINAKILKNHIQMIKPAEKPSPVEARV